MATRSTTAVPRRQRARRGDGELLRAQILEAAGRLLAETGSEDAVSIRAVADAVGVTPPSIYLHFPDKDALITAVCSERFREFDALLEAAGAQSSDPVESLRLRGPAYVRFGMESPEHYRVLFMTRNEHGLDEPGHEAGTAAFTHLVEAVQRCIDAGAIRASEPLLVAIGVWATMHGITSLLISLPNFPWPDVDTLVTHAVDTYLSGLAPGQFSRT